MRVAELLLVVVVAVAVETSRAEISCPPYQEIPFCSCFVLDDQLHIQCSGNDIPALEKSLSVLNGPVKSFSVYDLESRASVLPNGLTDNVTSPILQFSLSHSSLEDLGERSLRGLSKSLESLAVVSARLKFIPQTTLSTLRRLKTLDFEGNHIQELGPYSFHNILLQKVNLKGNQLENVSEQAFWGLEETLMEIDMSENKLRLFPYFPLRRLRLLSSLNLAWNEMSELSVLGPPRLSSPTNQNHPPDGEWLLLKYLNLNSNYLRKLVPGTFVRMGNLRTLSIHLNSMETVDEEAFLGLTLLESVDMSHNKLRELGKGLFRHTPHILTIDLSNNHIHRIHDTLFNNLSELRELFLNGNNLLQLSGGVFEGSDRVQVIYLQQNALRFVEAGVFNPLRNLTEIRLSDNFLSVIPQDLFFHNEQLSSLSLDGNLLTKIVPGTFHNCKVLRELRLQNNEITTMLSGVLDVLPELEEVYLENNRLSLIEGLDSLKSLRHVSLSRNSLERLSSETLPGTELSSLSLGHNHIRIIDDAAFVNQTSLNILFLGNNRLSWLGPRSFLGLRNLERLYLQRNNLSSIHADAFSNSIKAIQYIDLSLNSLRTISQKLFSGLPFIEEINLAENAIITIEDGAFTNLRSLRIVDLSHNKLTRIVYNFLFQLSGLEILKVCCNGLTEFARGGGSGQLIGLKDLDLRDNAISGANLRQLEMPRLEVFQLSGNNLTDVDDVTFFGFPGLSFLGLERCHLASLPVELFRRNPSLTVLRLGENSLTWIPDNIFSPEVLGSELGTNHNAPLSLPLRELHLRHNKFRNFPYKPLANLTQLQVLSLSGNRINGLELSRIKLPGLKQLDLNDNRLSKVSGSSLGKSMPSLEVVDFGENNISRLFDDFLKNVTLTQINFGGNGLQRIPWAFSGAYVTNPYVLNMSGNPLVNFYTENHSSVNFSVMDLYLSDTNVSVLTAEEFRIYPNLHRLVIKRNPLKVIPASAFSPLVNLNLLDLSENDIENYKHESFLGLSQLKSLNVSHNRIKSLSSFHHHLAGLQDLDLSFNQLSTLLPEALTHLVALVSLRLRGNWITTLPPDFFGPLARLSILDLSHNFIETVPSTVLFHLETRITSLRLEENPLNCDCESKDFWEWLQSHPKIFATSTAGPGEPNFVCERPEERRGRLMLDSDLPALCSSPAILKLAIQDVRPSSAVVSWQGRNNSGMHGYVVAYHALNHNDVVRTRPLPATSRFYLLPDLQSDTPYLVCVLGLSNDDTTNMTTSALTTRSAGALLRDSPLSKCAQVRTLGTEEGEKVSILHRRLGVLVGAVVGFVVFVIFVTTLACVKVRKRRRFRQQQNGKVDHRVGDALPQTNNVGALGGFHQVNNHHVHSHYAHSRNGNGTTSPPGHLSPDFLTYRHYSLATEAGLHPSLTTTTELERL